MYGSCEKNRCRPKAKVDTEREREQNEAWREDESKDGRTVPLRDAKSGEKRRRENKLESEDRAMSRKEGSDHAGKRTEHKEFMPTYIVIVHCTRAVGGVV